MLKRIVIIGTSGAGKSTLARKIASKLNITWIEMDALFWNEDWQPTPDGAFRQKIQDTLNSARDGWVIDGNYRKVSDLFWNKADTVIWLDYPLWLIYWRIVTRTIKRIITREELWNGNRESIREAFFSKDSIIWWVHSTYHERKQHYTGIIQSDEFPHLTFIHFTSPQQTEAWLMSLPDVP